MPLLLERDEMPTWPLPGWLFTGYAAPSRGSTEVCVWLVRIEPNTDGPLHTVDSEIVEFVLEGTATVVLEGTAHEIVAGNAFIIPAHTERKLSNYGDEVCKLVTTMKAGGRSVRSDGSPSFIPWAL